jgi:predicted amidohydrolase
MRFAAFQFEATSSLAANLEAIERGIRLASARGVRFLLTQECGLTGYPPLQVDVADVDYGQVDQAIERVQELAAKHQIFVALGTVLPGFDGNKNSLVLISPHKDERQQYDKRALWGWDRQHFIPGINPGIFVVDGIKIGLRICFEIRFPEYFRELFKEEVDIALVSFCDFGKEPDPKRNMLIQSHIVSRAVENAFHVMSANTVSQFQTAPTCVVSPDGAVLEIAESGSEALMVFDFRREAPHFGRQGRIEISKSLLR